MVADWLSLVNRDIVSHGLRSRKEVKPMPHKAGRDGSPPRKETQIERMKGWPVWKVKAWFRRRLTPKRLLIEEYRYLAGLE